MDSDQIMHTLLTQARVCLAQGQPTQALNLVLAAVRHQRGEAGVFEVLNETREAHGLARLASPDFGHALPAGSASTAARLKAHSHNSSSGSSQRNNREEMMDDEGDSSSTEQAAAAAPADNPLSALDPADAVETMFRRLNVAQPPPQQHHQQHRGAGVGAGVGAGAGFGSASAFHPQQQRAAAYAASSAPSYAAASSSSAYSPWASSASPAQPGMDPRSHYAAAASSSPSHGSRGGGGAGERWQSYEHEVDALSVQGRTNLTYPTLRTVLPALSGSVHSSATLELMHEAPMMHSSPAASAAAPVPAAGSSASAIAADSASASNAAAAAAAAAAAPLLCLNGREDILEYAYDDEGNVSCFQCGALVSKARFPAHLQYWCQNE